MPRPKLSVPTYKLHRPSGQACCYIDRQRVSLRKFGPTESKSKFAVIVSGRLESATAAIAGISPSPTRRPVTVAELLLRFVTEELPRYSRAEQACIQGVIRILRQYFAATPAAEFGPLRLRVFRQAMVAGTKSADLPRLPMAHRPPIESPGLEIS